MHNLLKTVYKTAYGYPYSERQTLELLKQMIMVFIFFLHSYHTVLALEDRF